MYNSSNDEDAPRGRSQRSAAPTRPADKLGTPESAFHLRAFNINGLDVTAQPFYYAGGLGASAGLELSVLGALGAWTQFVVPLTHSPPSGVLRSL